MGLAKNNCEKSISHSLEQCLKILNDLQDEHVQLFGECQLAQSRFDYVKSKISNRDANLLETPFANRTRLAKQTVSDEQDLYNRLNDIFILREATFTDVDRYNVTSELLEEIKVLDSASFIKRLLKVMFEEHELLNRTAKGTSNTKEAICPERKKQIECKFRRKSIYSNELFTTNDYVYKKLPSIICFLVIIILLY